MTQVFQLLTKQLTLIVLTSKLNRSLIQTIIREEKNETTEFEYYLFYDTEAFLSKLFRCDHGSVVMSFRVFF